MRIILALVAALVLAYMGRAIPYMFGMYNAAFLFQVAIFIGAFLFVYSLQKKTGPKLPQDFNASFGHDNIAIDTNANKIWLRDRKTGQTAILNKSDLLRWSHRYTSIGQYWTKNFIDLEVRDLNRPKYEIAFNRHADTKWGCKKNQAQCEEWQSRLTTWINNS